MSQVFISYRRHDSAAFAEKLHLSLSTKYGKQNVVFDRASIPPGVDFRDYVARRIRDCDVVIAVIGPRWRDVEKEGELRLSQDDDPVRVELEVALQANKYVIPVLLGDAEMPTEKHLPATLKTFAYRNAIRFEREAEFDADRKKLTDAIHDYRLPRKVIRKLRWALVAFVFLSLGLAVATVVLWLGMTRAVSVDGLKANLGELDGEVFARWREEDIKVARAFPDRESLDKAGSIKDQFLAAQRSLDLFVFSGKALSESETAMIEALGRGVRIRIVLVDHGVENQPNVANYLSMLENAKRPPSWYRANYDSTFGILERVRDAASKKGSFEVRTFKGPFASSFWVRDSELTNREAAHIAITLYGDDRKFPAVRFGSLSSEVVHNLASHFEYLWQRSKDAFH